jgi:protein FrlC
MPRFARQVWAIQAWDRSKGCLDRIALYASQKNITIVVEPTAAATNLIETADHALELMRSVERDNVRVMFDTLHALYRDEIPADYVRTMGKDLVHIHVSDSNRLLPGEGRVDWFGLMQTLQECRFDGYVTMELGLDSRLADPDQIAKTALKFLKEATIRSSQS